MSFKTADGNPIAGLRVDKPMVPQGLVIRDENWSGFTGLYIDEGLNLLICGQGKAMGLRLTPMDAMKFAEHLAELALRAIETDGLSSAPPSGSA